MHWINTVETLLWDIHSTRNVSKPTTHPPIHLSVCQFFRQIKIIQTQTHKHTNKHSTHTSPACTNQTKSNQKTRTRSTYIDACIDTQVTDTYVYTLVCTDIDGLSRQHRSWRLSLRQPVRSVTHGVRRVLVVCDVRG